jgi:septal ring factor EnvC (AmiA/AmiB activator)
VLILLFILQPAVPVQPSQIQLGPTGTIILVVAIIILSFLAFRQKSWKEAAAASEIVKKSAQDDLARARETIVALRENEKTLLERCAKAEAKVDLRPLENVVAGWIGESRDRFTQAMAELTEVRRDTNKAFAALGAEMTAQRKAFEASFTLLTKAFTDHVDDDRMSHEMRTDQTERITGILAALEQRTGAHGIKLDEIAASLHTS